ncbi:MAG: hypothetical protein V4808_09525 [Pseudomonadota bacterium]
MASLMTTGCVTASEPSRVQWAGEIVPGAGWLKRQGVETSYPIAFGIDSSDRATGTVSFLESVYPANAGKAALKGRRDPDGSAFYLSATVEGRYDLAASVKSQAEVGIALTGFDEEDGSLRGVGTLNMADLACLNDPARAGGAETCARRKVPVKWTAKQSTGVTP